MYNDVPNFAETGFVVRVLLRIYDLQDYQYEQCYSCYQSRTPPLGARTNVNLNKRGSTRYFFADIDRTFDSPSISPVNYFPAQGLIKPNILHLSGLNLLQRRLFIIYVWMIQIWLLYSWKTYVFLLKNMLLKIFVLNIKHIYVFI